MDLDGFTGSAPGTLVPIQGTDPQKGVWTHRSFVPDPLSEDSPQLGPATYRVVANARAALAALDSTARQLPNPRLLRRPTLQTEAQSTSALEGTYAPLTDVLTADEDAPTTAEVREIFNYVTMADTVFAWLENSPVTLSLLEDMQALLVRGTRSQSESSGAVRDHQVVVGRRPGAAPDELPVKAARFVPPPPGLDLRARLGDLVAWSSRDHPEIDPVVSAAMAHYQFETLHPFHDGNGRIGRLLVVVHLLGRGVLTEPTLTVSPWFESRRDQYYDHLLRVSTHGDWDAYVRFFAAGLEASANQTHQKMLDLTAVQATLKETVRRSSLRADTAQALVDYAVGHPTFAVRNVRDDLKVSVGRANTLVAQLVELGVLQPLRPEATIHRRFYSPQVLRVLVGPRTGTTPGLRL